jgi:polysaccharide transporter, PST family
MMFLKNTLYKKIFSNSFYLSINYAINFILPLIITPYAVRIIGIELFGVVSIAQYLTQYFNIIVDYGFNLTATREISINEHDISKISKITSTVIIIKLILILVSFLLFTSIVLLIPHLRNDFWVYFMSFSIVLGQGLSTNWFFQGLQQIKIMAVFNIIFKSLSVLFIFLVVKQKQDYIWINFLLGTGNILASVSLIIYIFYKFNVCFIKPNYDEIEEALKSGWNIFISNFYISIYNYSNIMILSLFATSEVIGIYSIIEKVVNIIRQIIGVLIQAVYPTTCKLAKKSYSDLIVFLKPIWQVLSIFLIVLLLSIYFYANDITTFIIGHENELVVKYLKIINFVPIVVFVSSFYLIIVLSFNQTKTYSRVFLFASIINVCCNFIFANMFRINGTIAVIYFTETFVLIYMYTLSIRIKSKTFK